MIAARPSPLTLALDASTGTACVALVAGEQVLAERCLRVQRGAGGRLLVDVDEILASQSLTVADLELIAVGIGPGSFTGIRVAMATARALAWATGCPVAGVISLEALAVGASAAPGALVAAALDARKGEVYGALYRVTALGERPEAVLAPLVASPAAFAEAVRAAARASFTWVGDGIRAYPGIVTGEPVAHEALDIVRGVAVAALGQQWLRSGRPSSEVQPVYLRRSEAELNLGPPTGASVFIDR